LLQDAVVVLSSLDDTSAAKSLQQAAQNLASIKSLAASTQQLIYKMYLGVSNTRVISCDGAISSSPKADRLPHIFSSAAAVSAAATTTTNDKVRPQRGFMHGPKGKELQLQSK
jgi:hypothetical protein